MSVLAYFIISFISHFILPSNSLHINHLSIIHFYAFGLKKSRNASFFSSGPSVPEYLLIKDAVLVERREFLLEEIPNNPYPPGTT